MELILILILIVAAIIMGSMSIGTTLDDFHKLRRRRNRDRGHTQPLVTALVMAGSDTNQATRTLESILASSYPYVEIIVICDKKGRPVMKKALSAFTADARPFVIYTGDGTLRSAYRRHGHGDIIITLKGDCLLERTAIEHSVRHFTATAAPLVLRPDEIAATPYSTIGLLQVYAGSLGHFWSKLLNLMPRRPFPDDSVIAWYRAEAFLALQPSAVTQFTEDVVIYRPAARVRRSTIPAAYRRLNHMYQAMWSMDVTTRARWYWRALAASLAIMTVLLPVVLTYALYLAVVAQQPTLIFLGIILVSCYLLFGVWSRPGLSHRQKVIFSLMAPTSLLPAYCVSFAYATLMLVILAQAVGARTRQLASAIKRPLPD